mgnify:CR=1 FL=1
MNQILEVIITKKKINFIATCPIFPNCKGIGKTRKEALKKLANAISLSISKLIKSSLSNIMSSDNYTQLLFDHSGEDHKEQIAFNLNLNKLNVPKSFLLKVASFDSEDESEISNNENSSNGYPNIQVDYESVEDELINNMQDDEDMNDFSINPQVSNDSESFVFGFPLNFN